jgi:hypothetical protein
MSFNPNQPPRKDEGTGPRQNQEPQGDEAALNQQIMREIMARSPTTTIPIHKPARGRQQQ